MRTVLKKWMPLFWAIVSLYLIRSNMNRNDDYIFVPPCSESWEALLSLLCRTLELRCQFQRRGCDFETSLAVWFELWLWLKWSCRSEFDCILWKGKQLKRLSHFCRFETLPVWLTAHPHYWCRHLLAKENFDP